MSMNIRDLCRLCANKHEISKDLLEDSNKSLLDIIRQFTQITVTECDNMPSRVCLDCEEKLVSFQLFILECYKVQDTLRTICLGSDNFDIKCEGDVDYALTVIKSEVKDEFTAEDLLSNFDNAFQNDDSSDNDDLDNVAISSLKEIKYKDIKTPSIKKRELTEEEVEQFQNILEKPNLRNEDLVKLECIYCNKSFKSWSGVHAHYVKYHRSKPLVYCACGEGIKTKSVYYNHLQKHKLESRRVRRQMSKGEEDLGFKVTDYVSFTCSICDKCFSSWYRLKAHSERYHKVHPIVRCRCGILLKSKSVLYKHVQDHKNPGSLSCEVCSKVFKTSMALSKHKMRHVPKSDRKFCCASCDKVFNNKDCLRSHEKSHIPVEERKVFSCEVCGLKFTTRSSMVSHKRVVHEKVKPYICDLCGYACGTNGELRQHAAIHSDDKPFVCKKCAKPFKTYSNLKTHMDTHAETSYSCYVCSRVLNSRRTLRKHLLVHEDKCLHICSYCNKAFKRRQTLKVHMYMHTGDKPLSCKWCDERFSYASTLRSHRLRCHPDKLVPAPATAYHSYPHLPPEEYIKSDLAAINVTKNEVEIIQ